MAAALYCTRLEPAICQIRGQCHTWPVGIKFCQIIFMEFTNFESNLGNDDDFPSINFNPFIFLLTGEEFLNRFRPF